MKKKILIMSLLISILFVTGCQLSKIEEEIIPVKPDDYETVYMNKEIDSRVEYYESDDMPIKEHVSSSAEYEEYEEVKGVRIELVDAPIIGSTSSFIDCGIEVYGVNPTSSFEGSYELNMTESTRYISSSRGLLADDNCEYNVDSAYYIYEDEWLQYKNVNTDAGNEWITSKKYDPVLDAYDVIRELNYSYIKDAEQVNNMPYIVGKYDLKSYYTFVVALFSGFDVSFFDLSDVDVAITEDNCGNVEKMEFISDEDGCYIKIVINVNASNNSKKIELPF